MNLEDIAKRRVITVSTDETIDKAIGLMDEHEIHHLPVVSNGRIVGMLSDRDILTSVGGMKGTERRLPGGRVAGPVTVAEIMSTPVHTLAPGDTVRLATRLMIHERIHAIPLVHGTTLVGIVTDVDLLDGILGSADFVVRKFSVFEEPIRSLIGQNLTTAGPRTSLDDLLDLTLRHRIRHLPIVAGNELLGIVSDRDLRAALGRAAIQDQKAQASGRMFLGSTVAMEIMHTSVKTIDANASFGQVVDDLLRHRVHCIPVLDAGMLVGVVTDTDILRVIGDMDKF